MDNGLVAEDYQPVFKDNMKSKGQCEEVADGRLAERLDGGQIDGVDDLVRLVDKLIEIAGGIRQLLKCVVVLCLCVLVTNVYVTLWKGY